VRSEKLSARVVYIATATNCAFLGDAMIDELVEQINRCVARSGTNVEDLLELTRPLRGLNISGPHVFELETRILACRTNELEQTETLS
jgi:cation transport regulator ChaC